MKTAFVVQNPPALVALTLSLLLCPEISSAQSRCEQLSAHAERLRQHVEQQRNRKVQSEQLNKDIEIYNNWLSARNRACAGGGSGGGGGGAVSGAGSRQQTIAELQHLIGLLGAMNSPVPGAADFERELQAQLELEEAARRDADAEAAQRRANTANPFAGNAAAGSSANPFSNSPPSHRLNSMPGTSFQTTLVEPKPARADNPFSGPTAGCPSDTPGARPKGASLSPDCIRAKPVSSATEVADTVRTGPDSGAATGKPFAQGQGAIKIEVTNAPPQPFGPAAGRRDPSARNPFDDTSPVGTTDRTTAGGSRESGGVGVGGRAGGPPSIHIQDASHCLETSEFTATLTSANGTSGYFTARNVCGYHVIGVGCYRRLSGGQTCVNVGGPAGHIARITFAYAATPLNKIGMTWKVCRTDNAPPMACFESVQSFSRQHDDGKRP
ncbi:MAG: hypothetical protein IT510_10425 [Sulfuritalea sp.]|jgi:hypothetical protein|nr:hypothetical protein [Sulfuritalea sp.]